VRARAHQAPELDVRIARAARVVLVRQTKIVAELVREHADAGVLRLRDVVEHLDPAGTRDCVTARRRVDDGSVRPDGIRALSLAAAFLAGARMDDDEVVDHTVGLVQVAVTVEVALILGVVLRPREVRLLSRQRVHGVDDHLGHAARVARMTLVARAT
jgi:hypothetical protein